MKGKKGIGPVLAMAFVILGVTIGVILLWVFAQKSINRGQDIIDPDCFTVDIELQKCVAYGACSYYSGNGYFDADILVKRGVGRANLTGIRFAFEDSIGRKGVHDEILTAVQLEELQSLQFQDPYPQRIPVIATYPHLVRAIPLVGENLDVCPLASNPVSCSVAISEPPLGLIPSTPFNSTTGQCCSCFPYLNYTECYSGNDTNYPIQNNPSLPNYGLVLNSTTGIPIIEGKPPGYKSVCCAWQPGTYNPATGNGTACPLPP